jgi:cytochrome c oxidase assembly protein subunit 20
MVAEPDPPWQSLSMWQPLETVQKVPCARQSLLTGIASGAGIGAIRWLSAGAFVASNWAVGTFVVVSIGTWHICQKNLETEHRKIQKVLVEHIPKRFAKKQQEDVASAAKTDPTP